MNVEVAVFNSTGLIRKGITAETVINCWGYVE